MRETTLDSGQVAVLGSGPAVQALAALGLKAFRASAGAGAVETAEKLVQAGFRVVFYTAELAADLAPVLEKHRRSAVPCLVALPGQDKGANLARLKDLVRRAVGADVFSQG